MAGYPNLNDPYGFKPGFNSPYGDHYPPPPYSAVSSNMGSQYFFIRSRLNGLVLDIDQGSAMPGTRVITWNQKGSDNQLWYQDAATGTTRSKLSPNLCLQPAGGGIGLVVQNYNPADKKQQLQITGATINMRHNPQNVVTIAGKNMAPGAKVAMGPATGGLHQQWEVVYDQAGAYPSAPPVAPMMPPAMPQPAVSGYFFIRSRLNNLVMDINGGNAAHGERVITWNQKGSDCDNQLWYEDANTMTYRSKKAPNLCLAAAGDGTGLKVFQHSPGEQKQMFLLTGNKLHLRQHPNKAVDISGAQMGPGGKLIMFNYHGKVNQQWEFVACPAAGMPPGQGVQPAFIPQPQPYVQAPPRPLWSLRRSPGSPPPDCLPLGHQNDGSGQLMLAVAHTRWGDIPGKAQGATCWFPYGGREELTDNFSWVCAPPGSTRLVNNTGSVPPGAMQVGFQNDGRGAQYAAIASTPQGHVPGKASNGTCGYSYGGSEVATNQFFWVTC